MRFFSIVALLQAPFFLAWRGGQLKQVYEECLAGLCPAPPSAHPLKWGTDGGVKEAERVIVSTPIAQQG